MPLSGEIRWRVQRKTLLWTSRKDDIGFWYLNSHHNVWKSGNVNKTATIVSIDSPRAPFPNCSSLTFGTTWVPFPAPFARAGRIHPTRSFMIDLRRIRRTKCYGEIVSQSHVYQNAHWYVSPTISGIVAFWTPNGNLHNFVHTRIVMAIALQKDV